MENEQSQFHSESGPCVRLERNVKTSTNISVSKNHKNPTQVVTLI